MKFVAISDTHGKHDNLILPPGDMLIHAGDISMKGEEKEVVAFFDWLSQQPFKYKVLIAGNHDFYFEREPEECILKLLPDNVIYLNDSMATVEGFTIWGSHITPWFFNWAFNRHRGDPIRRHWELIPLGIDILLTHGPAFRILDTNTKGQHTGCKDLRLRITDVKPRVHVFGHIHEAYGRVQKPDTLFINASVLNEKYELVNRPVVFEI